MPVSCLIKAAMTTADELNVVLSLSVMVPVIVAAGAGTAVRSASIPEVGPPVRTAMPCGFCQVLEPSTIVAKRP